MSDTFKCIHCREILSIEHMSTDSHHSRRSECKSCRRYKARVVSKLKRENINSKPSIKDMCIICQRTGEEIQDTGSFVGRRSLWTMDHDHITESFRGWICQHCNNGLGGFRDNVNSLERAILYLNGELTKDSRYDTLVNTEADAHFLGRVRSGIYKRIFAKSYRKS